MESMRRVEKRGWESSGRPRTLHIQVHNADVSSVSSQVACDDINLDETRDWEWWHGNGGTWNCSVALTRAWAGKPGRVAPCRLLPPRASRSRLDQDLEQSLWR